MHVIRSPASVSPSLHNGSATLQAYEVKFLLSREQAEAVEQRLSGSFEPDPHCDPSLGGMYAIQGLACDTPGYGVFFRDWSLRNRKYRVRRYGAGGAVFLERKRSRKGRVRKRRVQASLSDLGALVNGRAGDVSHAWFVRELRDQDLRPVCRLRYLRRALFAACPEGPARITFDRAIFGSLARGWGMDQEAEERPLLDGVVVCEFKFQTAMPAPLKAVVRELRLEATGVSKYRACVRAFAGELGLDLARGARANGVPHA